jgi:hypothetical protein
MRIQGFDDPKFKEIFFKYFLIKIAIYFLRPPQRTPKLQKKPSALKREHPALQNM